MFINENTAAQYEVVPGFEQDQMVHFPGKFSKMKSQLLPEEAQALIDNGVNYIRPLSQSTQPVAVAATATEEKKSELENPE